MSDFLVVVFCTKTELVAKIKTFETFDLLNWPRGLHYYHYISGNILQMTARKQYLWLSFPFSCSPPITRGASKELDGKDAWWLYVQTHGAFLAGEIIKLNNELFGRLHNKQCFCFVSFWRFLRDTPSSLPQYWSALNATLNLTQSSRPASALRTNAVDHVPHTHSYTNVLKNASCGNQCADQSQMEVWLLLTGF